MATTTADTSILERIRSQKCETMDGNQMDVFVDLKWRPDKA
jgi:hypothetical protein